MMKILLIALGLSLGFAAIGGISDANAVYLGGTWG
jgi:hypothetical protein